MGTKDIVGGLSAYMEYIWIFQCLISLSASALKMCWALIWGSNCGKVCLFRFEGHFLLFLLYKKSQWPCFINATLENQWQTCLLTFKHTVFLSTTLQQLWKISPLCYSAPCDFASFDNGSFFCYLGCKIIKACSAIIEFNVENQPLSYLK